MLLGIHFYFYPLIILWRSEYNALLLDSGTSQTRNGVFIALDSATSVCILIYDIENGFYRKIVFIEIINHHESVALRFCKNS